MFIGFDELITSSDAGEVVNILNAAGLPEDDAEKAVDSFKESALSNARKSSGRFLFVTEPVGGDVLGDVMMMRRENIGAIPVFLRRHGAVRDDLVDDCKRADSSPCSCAVVCASYPEEEISSPLLLSSIEDIVSFDVFIEEDDCAESVIAAVVMSSLLLGGDVKSAERTKKRISSVITESFGPTLKNHNHPHALLNEDSIPDEVFSCLRPTLVFSGDDARSKDMRMAVEKRHALLRAHRRIWYDAKK